MMAVSKVCEHCGVTYTAERKSSKYHSDACRIAAYRERHQEDAPPVLYMKVDGLNVRKMRIKSRPLDIEVEYELTDGRKQKMWFEFARYPRLETLFDYGVWDWQGLRFLISSWRENE